VILRCFLHGWLNIRARAKNLADLLSAVSERVWHTSHAPDRRRFAQRLRRLGAWTLRRVQATWVLEQVRKRCGRVRDYGRAYVHPGGHPTSTMLALPTCRLVVRALVTAAGAGVVYQGSSLVGWGIVPVAGNQLQRSSVLVQRRSISNSIASMGGRLKCQCTPWMAAAPMRLRITAGNNSVIEWTV
jgi:hypothetical protein